MLLASRLRALIVVAVLVACGTHKPPVEDPSEPPNILLIVVDTLRADRLSIYGHDRDTSPQMKNLLADQGVVVEHAYAQASWTIPSMASMMTGLDPALFLDQNGKPWGLPDAAHTLAEFLSEAGYDTRGFVANPTLHKGNGFAQGFGHFETAPYDVASLSLHADDLFARMQPHLGELREPFFLYAHYLDPHDPYDNPDIRDGRSSFYPDYSGKIRGGDVHGLYLRRLQMEHPEQDVEQLRALYDSEIRYVDRYVGELLSTLSPELLSKTLVVLTSDHGEELFDHGGWKHGETVYNEQIHVPLVFRWDGRLQAGRRVEGPVRLLDIVPTVLDAAGLLEIGTDRQLHGRSLLPGLMGESLVAEPVFSRHHADGPIRMARIDGSRKVVLFDRETQTKPAGEREQLFLELDRQRMQRLEIFDLASDPGERQSLVKRESGASGDPLSRDRLSNGHSVLAGLDPFIEGVRIFVSGLATGRVEGRIELAREPSAVRSWFLGPEDRVDIQGRVVTYAFTGDGVDKGISIEGALGEIVSFQASSVDFEHAVRWAGKATLPSFPAGLRSLLTEGLPLDPELPALHLWLRKPLPKLGEGTRDAETRNRLKALGYTD